MAYIFQAEVYSLGLNVSIKDSLTRCSFARLRRNG